MLDLVAGSRFGGHRIEAEIGRGGMGVVYLAVHERLKQRRALKVIAPEYGRDDEFRSRFEHEWEVAAAIDHPHVIPVHDAGEDGGQLYIAMRYVDGIDMRKLIGRDGRLSPSYTAEVIAQVASALDAAHARGLVHRDIKPANVLIRETPEGPFAYLTDFGLTKGTGAESSGITRTGIFVGTLDYIAPEQLDGVVTTRSDIYALGCLTYHALSGTVPYPQPTAPAKMWAHLHAPPPHLTGGPGGLADVIARAMAKDPDDRFASAGDFARRLKDVLAKSAGHETRSGREEVIGPDPEAAEVASFEPASDLPGTARSSPPASQRPLRLTRRRAIAVGVVVALCVGLVVALLLVGVGSRKAATTTSTREAVVHAGIRFEPRPFGRVPQPKQPIAAAAGRLKGIYLDLKSSNCAPVRAYNRISAAQDLYCDESYPYAGSETFTVTDEAAFSTGGIVKFTLRGHSGTYPMALERGGTFVPSTPNPGTRDVYPTLAQTPRSFAAADETAQSFVEALREGKCHALLAVTVRQMSGRRRCPAFLRTFDRAITQFVIAPEVDVFRLGGTEDYVFYGVRSEQAYRTLTVDPLHKPAPVVTSLFPLSGIPLRRY